MKNRGFYWRRYKIQETLYIGQWCLSSLQSRHLATSHSSPNCHQLPCCILLNLTDGVKFLPFQGDFGFGKSPKLQGTKFALLGDWVTWVTWCFAKISAWDMMHDWVHYYDEAASHQLPIAVAFWIIRIVSAQEYSSLTQNLMQIRCSTCSVILNVMATQYTCSLNNIHHPHWLVQWSHHCSHMGIPVHSPWLPGYIDVMQNILVILTMAGLFLETISVSLKHVGDFHLGLDNVDRVLFKRSNLFHILRSVTWWWRNIRCICKVSGEIGPEDKPIVLQIFESYSGGNEVVGIAPD